MGGVSADTIADVSRARCRTRALGAVVAAAGLAVAPLLAGPALAAPATAHPVSVVRSVDDPAKTPLTVTLTSMAPSEIPRKGVITLTGVVKNTSQEDWADINVAPFVSQTPITTRDGLALAAAGAANLAVGGRLTDSGTYAAVGDLPSGASARFRLRVPVTSLGITGDPGVYWIGAHALGASSQGRDLVADGRARTFIPLVPTAKALRRSVPVSLVLPLRERVRRAEDGSLFGPARWAGLTGSQGRLSRLAQFGSSAGTTPLTWLVDPAVLDALDDYSRGNPPLSLDSSRSTEGGDGKGGADQGDGPGGTGAPSDGASPSASAPPAPGTPSLRQRERARGVLDGLLSSARSRTSTLLTLGYSDPDVASLVRHRARLMTRAHRLAATRMKFYELTGSPTVAPPDGYFDPDLLPQVAPDSLMLLSDHGELPAPPLSRLETGQEMVLSDARASAGGPAPTTARDPLALRQRILAEAALEETKGDQPARPIVVMLPAGWDPGASWRRADFFGGLATPWVRMSPIPRSATTAYAGKLPYGRAQLAREISDTNVAATRVLARTSTVLGDLLSKDRGVTERLTGSALQASSYSARPNPSVSARQVLALNATVRGDMDRVQVTGSDFVTLSGGSGSLTVTLVNGLQQPIKVGLKAWTDSPQVTVTAPDPVSMQPGQRTTLRLEVASGVGVHDVTISPVTTAGARAGTPLTFSLRTSQVGQLIWYIIFAGGALLVVMIVRRIVMRVRNHRWRQSEAP